MKKQRVHVAFDGRPGFGLHLELDDVIARQDFYVLLAIIVKRAIMEGQCVPGIRWDPDAVDDERKFLGLLLSAAGQPIQEPRLPRRTRRQRPSERPITAYRRRRRTPPSLLTRR